MAHRHRRSGGVTRPVTRETPAPGLVIWQPKRGFRYSLDAFCLAGWALEGGTPEAALDVGTGSGVIALLLRHAGVGEVVGIDVQEEWLPLARRSARDSGLDVRFACADVRTWPAPRRYPLVLSNPPYRPAGSGPVSPDPLRAAARHALHGDLGALVTAMAARGERVCLVLPQDQEARARLALSSSGRPLARRCTLGARLVLLEGRPGGGPVHSEHVDLGDDLSESARVSGWYARLGVPLRPNPSPAP